MNTARTARTGTVWDSVKATQPVYQGSVIPKSFELTTSGGQKLWVHPNATKHIAEFAQMKAQNSAPDAVRMATQAELTSFRAAVESAIENGIRYDELITVGGWELKFGRPGRRGNLPVKYLDVNFCHFPLLGLDCAQSGLTNPDQTPDGFGNPSGATKTSVQVLIIHARTIR